MKSERYAGRVFFDTISLMDPSNKDDNTPRQYEVERKPDGRFRVVTHGKEGADQFEVDSVRAAKSLNEPLWVTLMRLFLRNKPKNPPKGK